MIVVVNVLRTIWQSKIMTLGVVCEILAVIAAALSAPVIPTPGWLPYAALLMATIGAVIVAGKVAWDYHGRGLNATQGNDVQDILTSAGLSERQREDVQGVLGSASLNPMQMDEVGEAIKSSGLTERQKSELEEALKEVPIVATVFAQKAVSDARDYLLKPGRGHGHVVVINRIGFSQYDVQYLDPPWIDVGCPRSHAHEQGNDISVLDIARSLLYPFGTPAVLWKHPGNGQWCYTNHNDPRSFGNPIVFNIYDCVPEWRGPAVGDYVLTTDESGKYTWKIWEQKSQSAQ